ncbi:MAG: tetratricopeptide repeat protein [Bacteroidota bacterium]
MPRLYLVLYVILFSTFSIGQVKTKKLVEFADKQFKKGDYYYAIEYYQKALKQDSTNLDIQWKYAEVQRAYKNYVVAEEYYSIVFERDGIKTYPSCILQLGLMQKQNGKYAKALQTFKQAKREYEKDKSDYLFKKSIQEIDATNWAIKHFSDTLKPMQALPETINSVNAEFGHTIHDNQLIFSSLRADSINTSEEVFSQTYKTHLYYSKIENGELKENQRIKELFNDKISSGNGTFSLDGKRFYYSICDDEGYNYKCRIVYSNYENGKWSKIDTLGKLINEFGKNSTMPTISRIEGKEVMFFASDKTGTKGGLDIWMAQINGIKAENVQNISEINTVENEITPWYDSINKKLYFSSSWHYGFGGQDIFYSEFPFKTIENAGLPINSPANDQYFFVHKDTTYVSSNRLGSNYAKNPTCCSDIYAKYPKIPPKIDTTIKIDTTSVTTVIKKKLPVRLYFRNDEPDEDSWATSTKQNYMTTYNLYKKNYELYKREVGKGLNTAIANKKRVELEQFFKNEVDKGANDLVEFTGLLLQELTQGSKIVVSIKGFASPLAKTNYNVNLTKRRISSLVNYFNEYNHGEFKPYLNGTSINGGKLILEFIPFGEFNADQTTSDKVDKQNESVYSKEAGIERKLHIEEVTFEKNKETFPLYAKDYVYNAGVLQNVNSISGSFTIMNRSNSTVTYKINNSNPNLILNSSKMIIEPNTNSIISFKLNTTGMKGFQRHSFQLEVEGFENKLELFITSEVKK